ncbi:MAG TPA: SMP-30/gluconolactonase/LRE family protein, partial [Chloroflexota bacterium]|nr:SMP-30/gluconolactonase/LRE family protein [Chloroflexota bacterium]
MEVELLVDAKAITGEGPVWDERDDGLYWVDIMRGHLHRY